MTSEQVDRIADLLPGGKTVLDRLSGSRKEIVAALKVHGTLTTHQLATMVGITSSGTRQQLSLLESEGYVSYVEIGEARAGRRRRRYSLTDAGHDLFPTLANDLAISLLEQINDTHPDELVGYVERWAEARNQPLRIRIQARTAEMPRQAVMREIFALYRDQGFLPVWSTTDDSFTLLLHHCPWGIIADLANSVCDAEAKGLERSFRGAEVERTAWRHAGDRVCSFVLRFTEE